MNCKLVCQELVTIDDCVRVWQLRGLQFHHSFYIMRVILFYIRYSVQHKQGMKVKH